MPLLPAPVDYTGLVGAKGLITWRGRVSAMGDHLRVPVTIVEVKTVYGRVDLKVTPVGGVGFRWVTERSFTRL